MPCQWGKFEERGSRIYKSSNTAREHSAPRQDMCRVVPKIYSRGSILPRARCFCLAFSGPPLSTRACSSFILAMTSRICLAFSLNSVAEVSTLVGSIDTADAWCACACVAIDRPHRCPRFAIWRTAVWRAAGCKLTAKHLGGAIGGIITQLSSSEP